jgi:hypothetical protein
VLLVFGCIGQDEVREPSATPTSGATVAIPSVEASPTTEATPVATATPTEAVTPAPTASATAEPSPTGRAGSADTCTGTEDNREFLADVAEAFDWPVYCAVLPDRWFVESGQYRSAGGGWMVMAYEGPGGAAFELHEGAHCAEDDGCAPDGTDTGTAAFGDQSGTLVTANDGRYAIVVDRGEQISWMAVGSGLDLDTFKELGAALVRVED